MYYVIQENVFRDIHYDLILQTVERLQLDYEVIQLNKSEIVHAKTERTDVFCFGSIKLARLAAKFNWHPGSLMNSRHDYEVYSAYWKAHLLNSDSQVQSVGSLNQFDGLRFIRPTKDSKLFTGQVFSAPAWLDTKMKLQEAGKNLKEMIQIAKPKTIFQEIRCWIVDRKVVTASTYKVGTSVRYTEFIDEAGIDFASEMAELFQPADAFVLDICLTDSGWKIVEANCINSAGFYAANLQKLVIALEDHYQPRGI